MPTNNKLDIVPKVQHPKELGIDSHLYLNVEYL